MNFGTPSQDPPLDVFGRLAGLLMGRVGDAFPVNLLKRFALGAVDPRIHRRQAHTELPSDGVL